MTTPDMATQLLLSPPPPNTEFLIGWISILKEEYRAALRTLDSRYDRTRLVRGAGDKNHYTLGRVGEHNVVMNLPPAAMSGQIHGSHIAADMVSTFPRLRFVLLVGIGGGVPSPLASDIRLGDVVLGTRVVLYGEEEETDAGFEQTVRAPCRKLLEAIVFLEERLWSGEVTLSESVEGVRMRYARDAGEFVRPRVDCLYKADFTHKGPECDCLQPVSEARQAGNLCIRDDREGDQDLVRLFQGVVGSGHLVMKNARRRDEIASRQRILCFEMEAHGVMHVTPCLPIKGISDYADGHKNDAWQLYASLAAATCARELLLSISPQVVARFPLTLSGDALERYVTGAASNPTGFAGSEIERLQQMRDSLVERRVLLGGCMISRDDLEVVRGEMQRLNGLQATLQRHLQDLDQILHQHEDLLSSHKPLIREQYLVMWEWMRQKFRLPSRRRAIDSDRTSEGRILLD